MNLNLSASEQLAYTTTRIYCETDTGNTSTGTGSFFCFSFSNGQPVPVIITNRHVVKNSTRGVFQLTRANNDGTPQIGKFEYIDIEKFERNWIPHPNPDIDLCIMPLGPLLHETNEKGFTFFYRHLDENLLPSTQLLTDLTAVEEILMIGYPVGLWDSVNNMPIFRRGITATHPNLNYQGRDEFLIDAACFPGSSGSPILLYNLGNYTDRQGSTVFGTRIALLGIMYAGPQYTVEGEIKVLPIPTQLKSIPLSRIPVNLGIVIKAIQILEFKPIIERLLKGS